MEANTDDKFRVTTCMTHSCRNVRFGLACFASAAVALPVAIISIAEPLLFVCALVVIVKEWRGHPYTSTLSCAALKASPTRDKSWTSLNVV